jgi:hypothetical protein
LFLSLIRCCELFCLNDMTKKLLRLVYAASENKFFAELFQFARLLFTSLFKKKIFFACLFWDFQKELYNPFFFPSISLGERIFLSYKLSSVFTFGFFSPAF